MLFLLSFFLLSDAVCFVYNEFYQRQVSFFSGSCNVLTVHCGFVLGFLQKELGVLLTPPTGKQKAEDWRGLETERSLQIEFEHASR